MNGKILAKIKKLLALGESTNPHEAALAMSKAQELMREHQLTSQDIELSSIGEYEAKMANTSKKQPRWHAYMISLVCNSFAVEAYITRRYFASPVVKFVGTCDKIEIAAYFYVILARKILRARKEYAASLSKKMKPANRIARADLFCEGWVYGVSKNVHAISKTEQEEGLVKQYLHNTAPAMKVIETRGAKVVKGNGNEILWKGYASGKEVKLNIGVSGDHQKQLGSDNAN